MKEEASSADEKEIQSNSAFSLLAIIMAVFCFVVPILDYYSIFEFENRINTKFLWSASLFFTFILIYQIFPVRSALQKMREEILALEASIKLSKERRESIQKDAISLVEKLARDETSFHFGMADRYRDSFSSTNPSVVLASLSGQFPQLSSSAAFQRIYQEAVNNENELTAEMKLKLEKTSTYNSLVSAPPTSILAGLMGFKRLNYE